MNTNNWSDDDDDDDDDGFDLRFTVPKSAH